MPEEKDDRLEKREITIPSDAISPRTDSANPKITEISIPDTTPIPRGNLFRRHWKLITIAGIVAFAAIITIPNSLMDFPLKWRELFKGKPGPFTISTNWFQNGLPSPQIWCVENGGVTPIYWAALAEFTSHRKTGFMFSTYVVEQQDENGKWIESKSLPILNGLFFSGTNLQEVHQMEYVTFKSAIENKTIAPGETVRGWIFLDRPARTMNLKFWFKDTTGASFSGMFTNINGERGDPVQPISMKGTKATTDISGLPRLDKPKK